jgi:hypothetical protein
VLVVARLERGGGVPPLVAGGGPNHPRLLLDAAERVATRAERGVVGRHCSVAARCRSAGSWLLTSGARSIGETFRASKNSIWPGLDDQRKTMCQIIAGAAVEPHLGAVLAGKTNNFAGALNG